MSDLKIDRIHHVAYRCKDAKETVLWYGKMLHMDFVLAIAEDQVPNQGARPVHARLPDAGGGNVLAFFELPTKPPMGRDPNTPGVVQHIAFKVKDRETLLAYRSHLEANGVEVLGVTDHGAFHSIYFFDPNGHRVELACPDPEEAGRSARLDAVKWEMLLEEWSQTKRAPRQAAFLRRARVQAVMSPRGRSSPASTARTTRHSKAGSSRPTTRRAIFLIQNPPFGHFRAAGDTAWRIGVAIGDQVLAIQRTGLVASDDMRALLVLDAPSRAALRASISRALHRLSWPCGAARDRPAAAGTR